MMPIDLFAIAQSSGELSRQNSIGGQNSVKTRPASMGSAEKSRFVLGLL